MKNIEYTPEQKLIFEVYKELEPFISYDSRREAQKKLIDKYKFPKQYSTLREYISQHACGAYHDFHFNLNGKDITVMDMDDFLTDELCTLYPLTNNYYVIKDERRDNNGNCENYHCDHYLTLDIKED